MDYKKLIPLAVTVAGAAATSLSPEMQATVADNPLVTLAVAILTAVLAYLAKSPIKK